MQGLRNERARNNARRHAFADKRLILTIRMALALFAKLFR